MSHRITQGIVTAAVAAALLTATACDDPTEVEGHFEVEGIALYEGTTELYRYMLDDGTPDPLSLDVGTHEIRIVLLDDAGAPIAEDPDHDEEHVLDVDITDTAVLTWTPEAHDHTGTVIEFHGELDALTAGTTTVRMCVPHEGHCDFEVGDYEGGSGGIAVTVTAP